MKKQFLSFLLLFSFVFSVAAQTQKLSDAEKNLRVHVAYLASDKLEGRRTGEQGATFAAGYAANMFANYKLKGGVSNTKNGKTSKNYLQTFPYVTGVEIAPTGNEFKLTLANTSAAQTQIEDGLAIKPVGFSPNASVENAQIVFVGYGIISEELKINDYRNSDVNGKVVVALGGNAESENLRRYDERAKAKIAKDKGAIGLLLISREAKLENDKLAQLKYDQTLGESAVPTLIISRKTGANILGIKETELKTVEDIKAINTLKVNIEMTTSPTVSFKINLVKKLSEAYNVIGILEGNDAVLKNEAIVIGAHYDHLGKGGSGSLAVNSTEIHHGADDNASGVAAMLELARQFAKEKKNKRTIIFIAFGGEEEGLLGSKFYVNNPVFPLEKTVAMINMDMVGRLNENKLTVGGIGTASEWKGLVESINSKIDSSKTYDSSQSDPLAKASVEQALKKKGFNDVIVEATTNVITLRGIVPKDKMGEAVLIAQETAQRKINNQLVESSDITSEFPIRILSVPFALQLNEDGFGPSDHSSFYGKQIPVLFFFTGTHADYHKPSDTADKINYVGLEKVMNFVGEIVKTVDQNPTRLTYAIAKSSGMGNRMSFSVTIGVVPSYAESSNGLLLDGVRDGSPAAIAGIKPGDRIIKLGGKEIRNVSDYVVVLGELKADTEYEIEVMRNTEKLVLKVKPAARK